MFGNNTEYAVRVFQKEKGLDVDGRVGPATLAALEKNHNKFAIEEGLNSEELLFAKIIRDADKVQNIENQKRLLLRKMDRSKRATNPNNFNEDGTIKKQGNKKVTWNKSNHYIKYQNQLKELYRKQADIRKQDHNIMANDIIGQTDMVLIEKMNFKGLQKRAKNTTTNEKTGKFNKKKRFGKSLANKAPAMLMTIIKNKLKAEV